MIRRGLANLGLVLFGLVFGLLLLEGGLRLAGAVMHRLYGPGIPKAQTGGLRILSLGDSNTYGLYVGKRHAYPQLIETQWNAHAERRPIEVINVGYPGNTSWTIRGELGDLLAAYKPDIVTIMLGVNDFFRQPMPDDDVSLDTCVARAAVPGGSLERRHRTEWRLVRALWLLNSLMAVPPEQVWFGDPRSVRNDPAWPSNLVANLELIVTCVQRTGAQVVLLTYPSSYYAYGVADDALRTVALDAGIPLIDLTRRFDPRCPRHKCDDYLYGDQHPTAAGHEWIAGSVVDSLAQAVPALADGKLQR